ncbi:MAG: hypothetical protein K0S41_3647 [Anaerocolumna sp.]|jgi:hypothetical protein|nr:hypothetical protein [Anaerocolumna sp.]
MNNKDTNISNQLRNILKSNAIYNNEEIMNLIINNKVIKDNIIDSKITSSNISTTEISSNEIIYNELKSLPTKYTKEMSLNNNDIMIDFLSSYNIIQLFTFISHVEEGIQDKVRLTKYELEGPPIISILQYDGIIIKYIIDSTRDKLTNDYITLYGVKIIVRPEIRNHESMIVFYLFTTDNKVIEILKIYDVYTNQI